VPRRAPTESAPLEALLLGNLVPGKRVAPFSSALAELLSRDAPRLRLTIAGDPSRDPSYAAECRRVVREDPALRDVVRFTAPSHAEALRMIAASDVFVSASRMESYGMALAEARAAGVPIIAAAGGNVGAHVETASGGELVPDVSSLARALVRLSGDPEELARRRGRAERAAHRRSWDDVASEFLRAKKAAAP
jgi:glycosyltransferase involved in cell wall biosynthesis